MLEDLIMVIPLSSFDKSSTTIPEGSTLQTTGNGSGRHPYRVVI